MIHSLVVEGVSVRTLGEADAAIIDDLLIRSADFVRLVEGREHQAGDGLRLLQDLPEGAAPQIKRTLGLFDAGERLVGVLEMLLGHPTPEVWYIGLLLLEPPSRNSGLGKATLSAVKTWASASGAGALRIAVQSQNTRGLAFWRRGGFSELYRVDDLPMGTLRNEVLVMGLELR